MKKRITLMLAFILLLGLPGLVLAEDGDVSAAICHKLYTGFPGIAEELGDAAGNDYASCVNLFDTCSKQGSRGIVCWCKVMTELFPTQMQTEGIESVGDCIQYFWEVIPVDN